MDDHGAKVDEQPPALGVPLNARGFEVVSLAGRFGDAIHQGGKLPLARAAANDEEVSEDGMAAQVQQDDVFRFLVFERIYQGSRQVNSFQKRSPCERLAP